jgi:predicted ABC-type ATPase
VYLSLRNGFDKAPQRLLWGFFFDIYPITLKIIDGFMITFDVCDLSHIYSTEYQYSLPQKDLEGFLKGVAFGRTVEYTPEEKRALHEDINEIYQECIKGSVQGSQAIITAGAPGAGKTTKLKSELALDAAAGRKFAYIDPDDVCLKQMRRTYLADIAAGMSMKDAYNKWRPASNAANHLILANLIRLKYSFGFGTTASSPFTYKFFEFIQSKGYTFKLLHFSAPDDVRIESIHERDKEFIQTTDADIASKSPMFHARINDYFKYASEIVFYYRSQASQEAQCAAIWTSSDKSIHVASQDLYMKVKALHDSKCQDPTWEKALELASKQ